MADTNLDKLKRVLSEIFMLDQADLDFGIYRIMNVKRDEMTRFVADDLLPQVHTELGVVDDGQRAQAKVELDEAIGQATALGVDPDSVQKVSDLRARYNAGTDIVALENEVFSHLASFFRRYYKEGDFLSLRRYKEGVYAIPYEGEEMKFHWTNADQYYIKSSEQFRDYVFKLPDQRRVHFKLASASTETDNNKPEAGNDRRFILCSGDAVAEQKGELIIRFEYRSDPDGRKRETLNAEAETLIFASVPGAWRSALGARMPTEKNAERTLLAKHLNDYTAKYTFDYFIHKHLGIFLRRELDFYIKNEVMHLDDIENEGAPKVDQYLAKIKAIRRIALKIIDMLSQLEDFQKKLWLKRKFVVETNYCLTLDRVPQELYPEIAANDAQRQEWVRLFAIDDVEGYASTLTTEFLGENPHLLIDTALFAPDFKDRLLSSLSNLDADTDGVLIHAENFQALELLSAQLRGAVKCIYIDPPYNTASSSIPYKNDYKHSSWASLMKDRLALLAEMLPVDGALFVSIDKAERTVLEHAMDGVFDAENKVEELIWSMNTNNSQSPNYSTNHEYVLVYAKDRKVAERDRGMFREPKPGYEEVMQLVNDLNPDFPAIAYVEAALRGLYEQHRIAFREEIEGQGLDWEHESGNDPWRGLFNYSNVEYRDANGKLVPDVEAKERSAAIWVWQEGDASMPATKQAASTQDPNHRNWRFYKPLHPSTKKPAPHPKSGWKFAYDDDEDSPDRRSFVSLDKDGRIAWGPDEKKVPRLKRMLHEVETNVGKSVFQDYSDGEKQTSAMFGRSGVFLAPKHSDFVSRFVLHAARPDSTVLDCFGGSGSTAHAVINLNRADRGRRKYVLAEMAGYFDTVLKPRVQKAIYSKDWRGGKPLSRQGSSHTFKYIRLESYEDAVANLTIRRTDGQQALLAAEPALKEDYLLRYMLDVETEGSASLLNVTAFEDPFAYRLDVANGSAGETRRVNVDLVETFNYLIGLRVKTMDRIQGFRVVTGESPASEKVLVIWRNTKDQNNAALDEFFRKQGYTTKDQEFDTIYVNGDSNLENLRREDETWKVRLIEEDFKRLMFDVRDV